jgi:hypothetical protein
VLKKKAFTKRKHNLTRSIKNNLPNPKSTEFGRIKLFELYVYLTSPDSHTSNLNVKFLGEKVHLNY